MRNKRRPLEDRFWDRVSPEPNSGCWLWTGSVKRGGYGQIGAGGRGGRNLSAHRVALELSGAEVPPDSVVIHKCDVPQCVNPSHLMIGTQADNMHDMCIKGRHAKGITLSDALKGKTRPHNIRRGPNHWNWGNHKPFCNKGHAMTADNIFKRPGSNGFGCKICRRVRALAYYHATRSKAGALSIKAEK